MQASLLDILRCPFCGAKLTLNSDEMLQRSGSEITAGVLACECNAYPIIDGIPIISTGDSSDKAFHELKEGNPETALLNLLNLEGERRISFASLLKNGELTYRNAIDLLCPDGEGTYFFHRFSDPTFIVGETLIRTLGQNREFFSKRALDVCGGSGHLTRVVTQMAGDTEVVLADESYWKIWLARRITAPGCAPVCCDGNNPLPFDQNSFSFIVCSDAFHYIWSKRLLACELMRLAGPDGAILLTHLHNSLCENESAGMPLKPESYQNLFNGRKANLYADADLFESILKSAPFDLSAAATEERLSVSASVSLVVNNLSAAFRRYAPVRQERLDGALSVNPLYTQVAGADGNRVLQLKFPSSDYEAEFAACKRYLLNYLIISEELLASRDLYNDALQGLMRVRILLDLPRNYI